MINKSTPGRDYQPMTVAQFIEYLRTQPQDLIVAHVRWSEYELLQLDQILHVTACRPRPDGWVQFNRPDMPQQRYLMLPGN